jgi:hypothetical protein
VGSTKAVDESHRRSAPRHRPDEEGERIGIHA